MSTLYIKHIEFENIRCFEHLELGFEHGGSSVLLLGDNGDGKSTFLRALAIGLCDRSSASALFRELPGTYVRKGSESEMAYIKVTLSAGGGFSYKITTSIEQINNLFEAVDQSLEMFRGDKKVKDVDPIDFPWGNIFLTAYGAGIRIKGSADFHEFLAADAIYPLFKYDAPLQNSELAVRRIRDEAEDIEKYYLSIKNRRKNGHDHRSKKWIKEFKQAISTNKSLRAKLKSKELASSVMDSFAKILSTLFFLAEEDTHRTNSEWNSGKFIWPLGRRGGN